MSQDLPFVIERFSSHLEANGLSRTREFGPDLENFGNRLLQYGGAALLARVVLDRGLWHPAIADSAEPENWHDAAILRDLLVGRGNDALPLDEQVDFLIRNWSEIVARFEPTRREETHARLEALKRERARRLFR